MLAITSPHQLIAEQFNARQNELSAIREANRAIERGADSRLSPALLVQQIAPYVGAKLNLERDEAGYVIPRYIFVDISERGVCYRDADIRRADESGVEIVNSSAGWVRELAWSQILEVVIRADDGSQVAYQPACERRLAA